ncbi:hypothetical protein DITRI_Ditri08aG0161800 [Diplodiscus trichospermus]
MQPEQKMLTDTCLQDLILLENRVEEAVEQAKLFRVNCREMGKRVCQLLQMLDSTLLCLLTSETILLGLNPIYYVISQVTRALQEALNLACKCRRKTIFCRFLKGRRAFHKLFHLLDACITNMKWILIVYNPDFNSVINEILLSLPQILNNDSSIPSAWSRMVTEDMTWELEAKLTSYDVGIVEGLMLFLAKLVETEDGELELQYNCLMKIMEITAAAESNLDLRCKAFKTSSPGSKAIVEQLLKVIEESQDATLQVLAIGSIGSMARIFSERENHHVIDVLVSQLENRQQEVASEAVVALIKYAWEENYLCKAHSKRMIEFNVVQPLMKLLRYGESTQQLHGLVLMCYLGLNADYSEAIGQARVLTVIQQLLTRKTRRHTLVYRHPGLKELVDKALQCLTLYYKY